VSNVKYLVNAEGRYFTQLVSAFIPLPWPEDAPEDYQQEYQEIWPDVPPEAFREVAAPPDDVRRLYNFETDEWGPVIAPPVTSAEVDAERDRRIASGFTFNGVFYQSRPEDRENIMGASTAALAALMAGAQTGDYHWHGDPETEFAWIAADNISHPMDAQTMFAFGKAAMAHKQLHIFAARALKDMEPIPADFATNPVYWPTAT